MQRVSLLRQDAVERGEIIVSKLVQGSLDQALDRQSRGA